MFTRKCTFVTVYNDSSQAYLILRGHIPIFRHHNGHGCGVGVLYTFVRGSKGEVWEKGSGEEGKERDEGGEKNPPPPPPPPPINPIHQHLPSNNPPRIHLP